MKNVFLKEIKNATRVIVTHKLSLIKNFDKIIFLKNGEILIDGDLDKASEVDEFREFCDIQNRDSLKRSLFQDNPLGNQNVDEMDTNQENNQKLSSLKSLQDLGRLTVNEKR